MFCFILALNTNHGKCPEGVRYIYEGNEPTIMDKVYIDEVHTKDVKFYGSFCAPVTGNYKFHIKGQSAITLKLGTINMNKHIV